MVFPHYVACTSLAHIIAFAFSHGLTVGQKFHNPPPPPFIGHCESDHSLHLSVSVFGGSGKLYYIQSMNFTKSVLQCFGKFNLMSSTWPAAFLR